MLRAGRRAVLVQAPAGVVGMRARSASPWAEPMLEAAASLLAGNAVLLVPTAPLAAERIAAAFIRAGVPGDLIAVLHGAGDLLDEAGLDRVVDLGGDDAKATMLVLGDAPLEEAVSGALWAAFAGAGRHPAAVGPPRRVARSGRAAARSGSSPAPSGCASAIPSTPTPRSARSPRAPTSRRSSGWSPKPSRAAPSGCAAARSRSPAWTGRSARPSSCAACARTRG